MKYSDILEVSFKELEKFKNKWNKEYDKRTTTTKNITHTKSNASSPNK